MVAPSITGSSPVVGAGKDYPTTDESNKHKTAQIGLYRSQ